MQRQLLKLSANILSLYIMATVFPIIEVDGIMQAITFGGVLWLINFFLRPLLLLITLPVNLLTLGIFSLLINTWMVMLADAMINGVNIPGFWFSLALAVLIKVFETIVKPAFKAG